MFTDLSTSSLDHGLISDFCFLRSVQHRVLSFVALMSVCQLCFTKLDCLWLLCVGASGILSQKPKVICFLFFFGCKVLFCLYYVTVLRTK